MTWWTDPEVFWIIKNGIKDTGMSAFGQSHDDADLWAPTAFIRQLETMTPDQYRTMTERAPMKKDSGHDDHAHASERADTHKH